MAKQRIEYLGVDRLDIERTLVAGGAEVNLSNLADEKAKVSSNDTTAGYLNGKLVAGSNVTLVENNNGGNETLTINANFTDADDKVKVSAGDTTPAFLDTKLVAGSNITLTKGNAGGNETYTVAANVPVTSVNTLTGAVTLTAASVGAAPTSHTHAAGDITSGVLATGRLASTGTASATTYLRGDQNWSGLDAGHLTTGTVPTARLATGTANSTTYLRGDQTWQTLVTGVTGFTGSQNTAAPNDTVNASRLLADAATTNADIVLQPKGTGAFTTQLADSTSVGGNKRGSRSVDLQLERSASSQVASGNYSSVLGGINNTASSTYSVVSGGFTNSATALASSVLGGENNAASGQYSVIIGGRNNIVNGNNSVALGVSALATGVGCFSFASGQYAATGDCQVNHWVLRRTSTDDTPLLLTSDGNTQGNPSGNNNHNIMFVQLNTTYAFDILVVARRTDAANEGAAWKISGLVHRFSGNPTIVGTPTVTVLGDTSAGVWQVQALAHSSSQSIAVAVTGEIGKTIRWAAYATLIKIAQ